MSDNPKEVEKRMAMKLFIPGDCLLDVFHLLPPDQLGLEIALLSHRFDCSVDEHFKTRKWTFEKMQILPKGWARKGTKEMRIVNAYFESLPVPQKGPPNNVVGFREIIINYIDKNVVAFLRRFPFRQITVLFRPSFDHELECVLRNIWPMLRDTTRGIVFYNAANFRAFCQFTPSMLIDWCPSLRFMFFYDNFPEFPTDDSATASSAQVVTKWLCSPRPDGVPKVLRCHDHPMEQWAPKMDKLKAAFSSAISPVNFIVILHIYGPMPQFDLTNYFTGERLTLKKAIDIKDHFLLVRRPIIGQNGHKWAEWENEAINWAIYHQWNKIDIAIFSNGGIGDGLLGASAAGSSGGGKPK